MKDQGGKKFMKMINKIILKIFLMLLKKILILLKKININYLIIIKSKNIKLKFCSKVVSQ